MVENHRVGAPKGSNSNVTSKHATIIIASPNRRRELRHLDLHRLRCDLKDFHVRGCDPLARQPDRRWVGFAKHLCGAATDFALRTGVEQDRAGCRGLGIATCCHHRCGWQSFTGKAWFLRHGFLPLEFELVSWMTGAECV